MGLEAAAITFGDKDELFHPHDETLPDWTETSYWGFYVPERKLSGTIYNLWRVNLGVVASSVWIWDDTARYPYEIPYCKPHWHVRIPEARDPTNFTLPTGLSVERIAPLKSHRFRYADPGLLELDLTTNAIATPYATFPNHGAGTGHFDQPIHVTGTLKLRGEDIKVDCFSMRDRTWSLRPEILKLDYAAVSAYFHGTANEKESFLALTIGYGPELFTGAVQNMPGQGHGYLIRDGVRSPLISMTRTILHRERGFPTRMQAEGIDELGRKLVLTGECVNHFNVALSANIPCTFSLTRWESETGAVYWGENQEVWLPATSYHEFIAAGGGS